MKRSSMLFLSTTLAIVLFFALLVTLSGGGMETASALPPAPAARSDAFLPVGNVTSAPEPPLESAPDALQGLDFEFHKWVVLWHKDQSQQDCDSGRYNHVLVVNYGDTVRYCYEMFNVGTTTIYTHTLWDDHLGSTGAFRGERQPGANLVIPSRGIPITEETKNVASWTVIDEHGDQLTKYDSNLVKVAIRFRGYTFHALPSDPAPKPKMAGVLLELYGWDEGQLITESLRMTTTSGTDGWWNFYMPDTYDHYQIRAIPPEGYVTIDAWTPTGHKVAPDTLQWDEPDRAVVQEAQFYIMVPTPTPTPTVTPTPPPDMKPGIWLPMMFRQ